MSYPGRPGGNDWEGIDSRSKGEYVLHTGYGAVFGEPICLYGTGLKPIPQRKRDVKSYDATAGTEQAIGVSLNIKEAIDDWTDEDYALKGSHVKKRDIALALVAAIRVKNVGSSDVEIGDTVIPADGGFEKMTSTGQYSLGKALAKIRDDESGYIWVNPDYEKPIL